MNRRIAYVTDIHLDESFPIEHQVDPRKNWENILRDISSRGIHEIIFGGDIGEKSTNQWFFESLSNFDISITLGNHDYFQEVIKHYPFEVNRKQTEIFYSQEHRFFKFIFLDSSSGSISQEQFAWLQKELSTNKKIILFIHHPILAVDAEVDRRFALKKRDRIKAELLSLKNEVTIFCGHYHFEDEKINANIKQYITPASSYQVKNIPDEIVITNKNFGYRIIELNDQECSSELVLFTSS